MLAVAVIIGASACYVIYNGSERSSIEAVLSEEEHARGLVMSVIGVEQELVDAVEAKLTARTSGCRVARH